MMSSNAAKVNSSCCVGSGSGSGGENNKRRRTEITLENSDENINTDALLELGKERLKAAQAELALAQQNVMDVAQNLEDIRQNIRSSGRYEVDSLLRLSHDDLFHIMCFLDVNDVGRCAMVCHALNNQTGKCWELFEVKLLTYDSLRSPSARNSRERVTRYYNASKFAAQIGSIGDHLSKHTLYFDGPVYRRVEDYCTGCNMPDLNIDVFHDDGALSDEYELFVRLSRSSDNKLFTEGFISLRELPENHDCSFLQRTERRDLPLDHLHFSWPELLEISRLIVLHGEQFSHIRGHSTLANETVEDLTVVVVAVERVTSKTCLVVAQSDFEWSFLDEGDYACCSASSEMSCCSHGPPDLDKLIRIGIIHNAGTPDKGRFSLICSVTDFRPYDPLGL